MACRKRTLLVLLWCACVLPMGDIAFAQDARWAVRTVDAQGRSESAGCAAARTRAMVEARKYLGLNIRGCTCVPIASKGDGPSALYRCRVTYEVLVRTRSH